MRYILTLFSVASVIAGCTTTTIFYKDYESAKKILDSAYERTEYEAYSNKFLVSQNQQRLDDNSGCYEIEKGTKVDLILTINEAGVISGADTSTDTPKARCFRKAYIGAKMPIPPFSPIAINLIMN